MPPLPLRVQNLVGSAAQPPRRSTFFPDARARRLFPVKTWRRLLQANLSHGGGAGLSQYGDPAGLPALRSAIADHLATTRGIAADPGRIVITNGAQEGISIAARLFLNHGTPSAIEDPCYQGAAFAFEATGSEITSVAVDFEGLIAEELPQRPTALLYVTPSHQYPTGHTLSPARRQAHRGLGAALRLLHPGRRSRRRSALRRLAACRRSPRWPRTAPFISARSRARSAPACGSATWSCPSSLPASSPPQKGSSTTAIPGSNRRRWPG